MRIRWLILSGILGILAPSAPAQEQVYVDDFEQGAEGWTVVHGASRWKAVDGRYVFEEPGWGRHMTVAPVRMIEGTITVRATPLAESQAHGWASFGVIVKYADSAHLVAVRFGAYNGVSVIRWDGGDRAIEGVGRLDAEVGREYEARLEVEGDQLRTFLDGEPLAPITIGWAGEPGRVGLCTETPASFDDFTVTGVEPLAADQPEQIEGTPRTSVEFASFQPDPLLPGEVIPVRGQLHLFVRNSGDGPAVLEGVELDGRSGEELVADGVLAWYHQHPQRIRPGEVGRVTLRLGGVSEEQALMLMAGAEPPAARVVLRHLKADPVQCEATLGPDAEPLRINMLTFGPDLRTVRAYLQAPDPPEGGFVLEAVEVNGRDVTDRARFGSRRVAGAVVPVEITLEEPLTWGRHATVTVSTEQGLSCGHCLRAFPSEFPIQVCLFEQVREDSIEDIHNHCFTAVAPRRDEHVSEMKRLGLDLLAFGGGLGRIMQWWQPENPRVIAFWLDERDERPVEDTIRPLNEAHEYYLQEGRYIPRQMINLVGPWTGTGMAFMDILDVVCHAYGMGGAINGADFPLLSSLPWRELRAGRRPWWPYFRSAEIALAVDPGSREVLQPAPTTQRVIEPAQERMMTYGCLQLGAKGICHWAYGIQGGDRSVYYLDGPGLRLSMGGVPYPTSRTVRGYEVPEGVCRALKATWDEIGRINAELQTIGPWVADSDPSPIARVTRSQPPEAVTGGPAAQASALVSGLDTVIVIALNLNIDTEWSGRDPEGIRSYEPVDATIELRLPEWIDPADTFSVDWRGIEDVEATHDGDRLVFELPELAIQRVIVVTGDPEVRSRMAERLQEMQERLRAMESHQPVPTDEE